ncbi:hypothetical protein [Furfurilactobacillus milii]|uniref:Uncharacterized protein n=1 Tax=Furfurilactobacillus rossiae TaxID=231049 RepID=A0A7C9MUD1_9LACO|nr:hypothetical protein [Furfurilactobacillus milii]MYV05227.1 hypothetical protein [Furfurilactobacillus milii]
MFAKLTAPIRELVASVQGFTTALHRLQNSVSQLSESTAKAQETVNDIQKSVEQFQFKTAAHEKVIQENLDKLNDDLAAINRHKDKK